MRSSPRRGGIGIRFIWIDEDGHESNPWDHALPATEGANNQQMELEAPYQALRLAISNRAPFRLSDFDKIQIRTDSEYVKEGIGRAISVWSRNGWRTRGGGAVLNVKDWKNLLSLMTRLRNEYLLPVNFEWKKGKRGEHAKAVDKLAKRSSDSPSFGRSRPNIVRRKTSPEQVDLGSVKMEGQVMTIHIIQAQYLPPPHRRSRYKYEVVDETGLYLHKVDWAESKQELKRGHTYVVRMNDVQENPRIEELLKEVEEDLTPYLEVLKAISKPATAKDVSTQLEQAYGISVRSHAARRRLDRLVDEDRSLRKTRSSRAGRPYLYEVIE
jgi:ribonuclease HI/transposase-like protein